MYAPHGDLTAIRQEMLEKLQKRPPSYSLEREFYTDPAYYQVDLDLIYHRDWIFAGHDIEIAEPGHFFTLQVGAYNVIVTRDKNGEIRAFHNTCRHRGSKICLTEKGKAGARLVCPYHQWTYDLDGKLAYARGMDTQPNFDKNQLGLKPVHVAAMGGYIWVCVAENPPDISTFKQLQEDYFGPHGLRDAKIAMESTIIEKGNWKLVWENNRECYHCRTNHPELCLTFPETPSVTGVQGIDENTELQDHWKYCESLGLPSKFVIAENGQYRLMRVPLIPGAETYTMTGQVAVKKPMNPKATKGIGSLLLFNYPSTWNHGLVDQGISFRVLPLSPTETQVTTRWMVHKDAVEGVDYDLKTLTEVWLATNEQDRRIVQDNQAGILSPAYTPGPYSEELESGCIQFVDWYCDAMKDRLQPQNQAGNRPKLRMVG